MLTFSTKGRIAALVLSGLTGLVVIGAAEAGAQKGGKSKGDIALGKKVYAKFNCGTCHVINKEGKGFGPELTKVATDPKHDLKWMEIAIIDPKKHKPDGSMPSYKATIKGKDLKGLLAYMMTLK